MTEYYDDNNNYSVPFVSPNGSQIIGTAEILLATARISWIDPDTGEPEYEGGTDIHWNSQETAQRDGKLLYVCAEGKEWTFDELKPV
ncbi:hypothetical protein [Rhizobium glycinendophyticum]|uniref:Uncharacterized protein n=1 Tax=Rhizobium glycinendophyticum TaxID=2589807 RepID=A0A504UFG2_9HYPH|nr:hypothetical protein [Rhizobium glycinendophyticum]TPP04222.1 hypothetical protein FJQ55_22440 [Rhizobium glycinendophyticum]